MLPRVNGKRINCISLSVNQTLVPLSNATMEVLKEDILPIRTYVEITTPNRVTEFYRTRLPQTTHGSDIATIQLDHAVCEVGDYLIKGEIKEETALKYALAHIFDHYKGSKWKLGNITASETVTVDCSYENVLEEMLSVLEQQPQYYMTFDFTTSPKWTINLATKSDTVTAEGRLSRNVSSAVVKVDDKDQCTRVYVKGLPLQSGQSSGEIGYMQDDAAVLAYGVIEAETGSGDLTEAQATRIATAYLNAHKEPKRSVEIDGDDLSEVTGETLDRMVCGKLYRLAIPDDGVEIKDYITKVSFSDVISSTKANIYIGDEQDPVIEFLQKQTSSSKSGGRRAKQVDAELADIFSEILETQSMIDTAVWTANSTIIFFVEETASQIWEHIGVRTGSKVIQSEIMPTGSEWQEGDLWIDGSLTRIWNDADLMPWIDEDPSAPEYDWSQLKGTKLKVMKDGEWKTVQDETVIAEDTDVRKTKDLIRLVAANLKNVNEEWQRNVARVDVKADQIKLSVDEHVEKIGSSITQTAKVIRSEVHAANSNVYSYIEQTATYIRTQVENVESGLMSSILQEADRISLVVQGTGTSASIKIGAIVDGINAGTTYAKIQATKINLEGYVTTSMMESAFQSVQQLSTNQLTVSQYFTLGSHNATWKDQTVVTGVSYANNQNKNFLYGSSEPEGYYTGHIVSSVSSTTIYYLGR